MNKTIDLRGLTCPEPVLKTKALFDDAAVKKVEALVDGEVNVNNLSRLGRSMRLKVEIENLQDHFKVTLNRIKQLNSNGEAQVANVAGAGAAAGDGLGGDIGIVDNSSKNAIAGSSASANAGLRPASDHAHYPVASTGQPAGADKKEEVGTVVFLGKDTFGAGDEEFSTTLISLFLQTMLASGHRPRAILLANTGVRLMNKKSSSLKVLNDFKDAGVEVLACGLCVDFYKVKEDVPTEQITNMFAICEYMFAADKVISP